MNFDQLGAQHISKRRKPSPIRRAKVDPSSLDGSFPQNVWPRRRSAANKSGFRDAAKRDSEFPRGSSGFSIPGSWLKNCAIAAGLMVIAIIGPNWDNIAGKFKARSIEVSQKSLRDPNAPLDVRNAAFRPLGWGLDVGLDEAENTAPSDIQPMLTDAFSWTKYEVQAGDTVSGLAERYSLSWGSIISINQLKETWNLQSGRILKIPNMDGVSYTIQKGDTISAIAEKMKVPQNAILDANDILSETIQAGSSIFIPGGKMDANEFNRATKRPPAEKPMIYPVNNRRVTSGFGWREDPVNPIPGVLNSLHRAVDLAGKKGDPVKAAMKGTVLYTDNNRNLGNFIILRHGEYQTLYAHLSAVLVKPGEEVAQGQLIGKVGDTGYTTGPHLHYEVFHNGTRVNPLELLR